MRKEIKKSIQTLRKNILNEEAIQNKTEQQLLEELENLDKQVNKSQEGELNYYRVILRKIDLIVQSGKDTAKSKRLAFFTKDLRKSVEDLEMSNPKLVRTVDQIATAFNNWGLTL